MDPLITACSCSKCLTFFLYCVKQLIAKLNAEDLPEAVSIFTEELLMQAELSVVGSSDDQTIAYCGILVETLPRYSSAFYELDPGQD